MSPFVDIGTNFRTLFLQRTCFDLLCASTRGLSRAIPPSFTTKRLCSELSSSATVRLNNMGKYKKKVRISAQTLPERCSGWSTMSDARLFDKILQGGKPNNNGNDNRRKPLKDDRGQVDTHAVRKSERFEGYYKVRLPQY